MEKVLPMCLYPKYRKGILMTTRYKLKLIGVRDAAIMDMPTTPPSMILLGIRKVSRPTA